MNLPFYIAKRYLFAKKSHNVINIISLISAVGIGIGSMALIVILSVYNGFDTLIKNFYQEYQPNFIITPATGKSFCLSTLQYNQIKGIDGVASVQPIIEENVFLQYGNNQAVAFIKGVDSSYGRISGIEANIKEGAFSTYIGYTPHAIIGRDLAATLRLRVRFLDAIELYFPDRKATIFPLNPAAALNEQTLYPSGIIALNQEFDSKGLFVPIEVARELTEYSANEITSLEIYLERNNPKAGTPAMQHPKADKIEKEIRRIINPEYNSAQNSDSKNETINGDNPNLQRESNLTLKNKYQQNETLYKMMRAEKFAVYLILFFIIVIVSVNIFGSLSMLILDKKEDLQTYMSMGATKELIDKIFIIQGWLISIIGSATGIILGLVLCVLQKSTGIISLPGNYIVSSYPVEIQLTDVIITFGGVALIGYIIALLPVKVIK